MKYKINDIHSHVVYGVDDGSKNLNMSIEMLRNAYQQRARNIVCTSHSDGDMKRYFNNIKILQWRLKTENININLHHGCEVYCDDCNINHVISELNSGLLPTVNKTKYVLVEFYPYAETKEIISCVKAIQANNYKIIIAHVERYYNLLKDNESLELLRQLGCLFQINAYSVYDEKNTQIKKFSQKLLKEKYVTFLGSDAHRADHRPYIIKNGVEYIYTICDQEYADGICYKNAENLLNIK